jgi:flagellar FliJ protein
MANAQLETVLRVETEREQRAAVNFQSAQQQLIAQQKKLSQLQQYRVDYIEGIKRDGQSGLGASQYQQHLSFVGKLDLACEQQTKVITKANLLVDQKRREWISRTQRKKAIEMLIKKRLEENALRQHRAEQQMMDEFANQQFFRRTHAIK